MVGLGRGVRRVAARSIEYGGLAVLAAAVFGVLATGAGTFLAVVVSAVTLEPARRGLRRVANRVVYGHRRSPAAAVAELTAHLARDPDPAELLHKLATVIRAGTGAERVAVWLRVGVTWVPAAGAPGPPAEEGPAGDLVVQIGPTDERLGVITVAASRAITPFEARLVADLAAQAVGVVRAARLRETLESRLAVARAQQRHLAASRLRLMAAQDEARRGLERDIHDGCQQHAIALSARVGLARATGDNAAARAVAEAVADLDRLGGALDRLTRSEPVPELISDGLAAALRTETATSPVPVEVVDDLPGRCAARVEAALFACCVEAVQNVVKHAAASAVLIRLSIVDGRFHVTVRDDGIGFDPALAQAGTGLANIRERLNRIGAELITRTGPDGTELAMTGPAWSG